MKRNDQNSPAHASTSSHHAGSLPSEPPPSFINELSALFSSGRLDLLEQKAHEAARKWPTSAVGWKAIGNLLLMQGRFHEALAPLTTALERTSTDAQIHLGLGTALLQLGQLHQAEQSFRAALQLKPDYVPAHVNLGITLFELRRFEEAAASYREALAIKPDMVEGHNNLGNTLKELGRYDEAEAAYRQVLALSPGTPETLSNLGLLLQKQKRHEEAVSWFRQAVAKGTDFAPAHLGLGESLAALQRLDEAAASFRTAIRLSPHCVEAHVGLSNVLGKMVPLWHMPMMNDSIRNDAYFAALRSAVTPDTRVLEIGTGSGLLSMMAAELGARSVTTCEAVPAIAETARAIIADNGFSSRVTVHGKMSTSLSIGDDLDEPADLLVSEILSSEFLSEGVLPSIEDAKRRLLKPGARIIPARGSIRCALFGGPDIGLNLHVDRVCGFELSRFNVLVPRKQYITRNDLDITLLSDDITAFAFDFEATDQFPGGEQVTIDIPVLRTGRCYGVIQWIRLEMDDTVVFENHPSHRNPASGWQHCAILFDAPLDLQEGQVLTITAFHNRETPWFVFAGLK